MTFIAGILRFRSLAQGRPCEDRCHSLAELGHGAFSRHAGRLCYERVIKPGFGLGDPDPTEIEDATGYFKQFASVLNAHLKGRSYLVGERLTVADFAVAAFLPLAKEAQLPLEGFHEVERWQAKLMELPAWRQPFPG